MFAGIFAAAALAQNQPVILAPAATPTLPEGELVLLVSDGQRYVFLDHGRTLHLDPQVRVTILQILKTPETDAGGRRYKYVAADGVVACDRRIWTQTRVRVFGPDGAYLLTAGPRPEQPILPGQAAAGAAGYVCDKVPVPVGNYVIGWKAALTLLDSKDLHPYTPPSTAPRR